MDMEADKMYIKVYNPDIKKTGKVDCGCEVVDVKPPYITIKLCADHTKEVNSSCNISGVIIPMVDDFKAPRKHHFRHVYLAAIPEES